MYDHDGTVEPGGRVIFSASAQTPQEVAGIIMELIKNPKAEIYTNPASAETAKAYYSDVGAFEDRMFGN